MILRGMPSIASMGPPGTSRVQAAGGGRRLRGQRLAHGTRDQFAATLPGVVCAENFEYFNADRWRCTLNPPGGRAVRVP